MNDNQMELPSLTENERKQSNMHNNEREKSKKRKNSDNRNMYIENKINKINSQSERKNESNDNFNEHTFRRVMTVELGKRTLEKGQDDDVDIDIDINTINTYEHEKVHHPPSLFAAIISGILLGVLVFVFASIFALIIFEHHPLEAYLPIGVSMHLASSWISGWATNMLSGCRVAIAATDVNVTVFLSAIAVIVIDEMPNSSPGSIVTTLLFITSLGTLMTSFTLYYLGRFRLTKMVKFVPASVLHGFLGCVGYRILVESLVVATGKHFPADIKKIFGTWFGWKLILPALPIGIALYLQKRYHWGKPTIVLPIFIIVPNLLFFIIIKSLNYSLDEARHMGWLFENSDQSYFYDPWKVLWNDVNEVNFSAVLKSIPDLLAMITVIVMDFLMKLSGTEKELEMDMDLDDEVMIAGLFNFANWIGSGVPAYGQMEFTVMNFDIIHNIEDVRPGRIASCVCLILYFWGFPIINYLPRFFLAGMIIYAGLGFVISNLVDSRHSLSRKEFATVWIILIFNIIFSLLVAIVIGIALATGIFVYDYSRRSHVKWSGDASRKRSNVLRPLTHVAKLSQLGRLAYIIQLQGALFFGTATKVLENFADRLHEPETYNFLKVRYLVLDFESVSTCDTTAATVLQKLKRLAERHNIIVYWCGMNTKVLSKLISENVLRARIDLLKKNQEIELLLEKQSLADMNPKDISMSKNQDNSVYSSLNSFDNDVLTHEPILSQRNISLLRQPSKKHLILDLPNMDQLPIRQVIKTIDEQSTRDIFADIEKDILIYVDEPYIHTTLDFALDIIEEELLSYADEIRSKWLVYPVLKKLNALSAFEAVKGPFDQIIDDFGGIVWRYVTLERKVNRGTVLFRTGEEISKLWILQHGRVSAYLEHDDDTYTRVSSKTKGWVNFGLFGYAAETVVADLNCTFITITEDQMDKMEKEQPLLALAVHRAYLEDASMSRNRLERNLDSKHTWDGYYNYLASKENDVYRRSSLLVRLARCVENEIIVLSKSKGIKSIADSKSVSTAMFPTTTEYRDSTLDTADIKDKQQKPRRPHTPPAKWQNTLDSVDDTLNTKLQRSRRKTVGNFDELNDVTTAPLHVHQMRTSSGSYQNMLQQRWKRKQQQLKQNANSDTNNNSRSFKSTLKKIWKNARRRSDDNININNDNKDNYDQNNNNDESKSSFVKNVLDRISPKLTSVKEEDESLIPKRYSSNQIKNDKKLSPTKKTSPLNDIMSKKKVDFTNIELPPAKTEISEKSTISKESFETMPTMSMNTKNASGVRLRLKLDVHELRKSVVIRRNQRISNSQRQEYTNYFNAHCILVGGVRVLPATLLRHALMDLGYYLTSYEMLQLQRKIQIGNNIVLDKFLRIMGRISQVELSAYQVKSFEKVFNLFCGIDQQMTRKELHRLLTHTLQGEIHMHDIDILIKEWDVDHEGTISFHDFLGMLGFALKHDEMNQRLNTAWLQFAGHNDVITPEDVQRVIYVATGVEVTNDEACEMIWEAQVDESRRQHNEQLNIDWREFVQTITEVYEPGWIVQWDWRQREPRRFAHDLIVEGEFDDLDDLPALEVDNNTSASFHDINEAYTSPLKPRSEIHSPPKPSPRSILRKRPSMSSPDSKDNFSFSPEKKINIQLQNFYED